MGARPVPLSPDLRALLDGAAAGLAGPDQALWLDRVEASHPALLAALRRALRRKDGPTAGHLAAALAPYWSLRGRAALGRSLLRRTLRLQMEEALRVPLLVAAGNLAYQLGDYEATRDLSLECLALLRARRDMAGIATALHGLASACQKLGELDRARDALEEAVVINRRLERVGGTAACLRALGSVYLDLGRLEDARASLEEALSLRQRVGDPAGISAVLFSLGAVCLRLGDLPAARLMHEKSLAIRRRLGDRWAIAHSLAALATVAQRQGHHADATRLRRESAALKAEVREAERKAG